MKHQIYLLCCLITLGISVVSCKKDDPAVDTKSVLSIDLQAPTGLENFKVSELDILLKELNTGKEAKLTGSELSLSTEVEQGIYDIQVSGKGSYTVDGEEVEADIAGTLTGSQVSGSTAQLEIALFIVQINAGFVLEEIFFAGNNTPEGEAYIGDRYIKIYNNSDQVLYADGLAIAVSHFQTDLKEDYSPNLMHKALTVDAIIRIPGSGTEHPVNPGESIVIAETAINHKELNPNAVDLSKADFEIYDDDDDDETDDVDNPMVPNVETFFDRMVIHNRGVKSYALCNIPVSAKEFAAQYIQEYTFKITEEDFSFEYSESFNDLPNEWIIDVVNLSVKTDFQWLVTDPSLDRGWTHCGENGSDNNRFGHSVIRKTLTTSADGHRVLQDTNNSTADFTPFSDTSLK